MGITSVSLSGEEYVIAEVNFFNSSTSLVSAVNHMAARAFRGEKNRVFLFFFYLNFNVYIGRFYTKDALSVWTNLGKYFVVRLGYASLV